MNDKNEVEVSAPDIKQGCGCALIILSIAVAASLPEMLELIGKLVDKL